MARTIGCKVWFDWDFNGSFTEETSNLVTVRGDTRIAPPGESITSAQGMIDSCTIELYNNAGRYSPLNSSGALYTYIQDGKGYHVPVYVETTINGTDYTRTFTGVAKIPRETGRTWNDVRTVEFECRGREELLLQKRMSTTYAGVIERFQGGYTEGTVITAFLSAASATPTSIDAGMVTIPWTWLDNESPLEDIWQIAAAAGGRFYADVSGTYTYENMAHWLNSPHATSQVTYTAADWERMEATYNDRELYDSVSVEYAGREPDTEAVIWEPDEEVIVPANSSKTVTATYSAPNWTEPAITWRAHTVGGADLTASVSFSTTHYAQRSVMVITNAHATLQAKINPFQITARPLAGGPTAEETRTSAADGANSAFFTTRGSRDRSVRGNVYIQTKAQAGMLAQLILDRHEYPRLTYRLTGVPGNAARRPGDRITVNDSSVMSSGREAIITGVSWRYGGQVYTMDITAIDAANIYKYLGASPGYFKVGTNKLGAADALRGRCFY